MSIRNKPRDAAVFGIDIGKTVFHVVGLDASHAPIQKATFRRETLLQFFERASPVLAHWGPPPCLHRPARGVSSAKLAIWRHGLGSCRGSTLLGAKRGCSASANVATSTSGA